MLVLEPAVLGARQHLGHPHCARGLRLGRATQDAPELVHEHRALEVGVERPPLSGGEHEHSPRPPVRARPAGDVLGLGQLRDGRPPGLAAQNGAADRQPWQVLGAREGLKALEGRGEIGRKNRSAGAMWSEPARSVMSSPATTARRRSRCGRRPASSYLGRDGHVHVAGPRDRGHHPRRHGTLLSRGGSRMTWGSRHWRRSLRGRPAGRGDGWRTSPARAGSARVEISDDRREVAGLHRGGIGAAIWTSGEWKTPIGHPALAGEDLGCTHADSVVEPGPLRPAQRRWSSRCWPESSPRRPPSVAKMAPSSGASGFGRASPITAASRSWPSSKTRWQCQRELSSSAGSARPSSSVRPVPCAPRAPACSRGTRECARPLHRPLRARPGGR